MDRPIASVRHSGRGRVDGSGRFSRARGTPFGRLARTVRFDTRGAAGALGAGDRLAHGLTHRRSGPPNRRCTRRCTTGISRWARRWATSVAGRCRSPTPVAAWSPSTRAVRTAVGVFDVSHLGKATVTGPGAAGFRQQLPDRRPRPDRAGSGAVHPVLQRVRWRRRRPDRLPRCPTTRSSWCRTPPTRPRWCGAGRGRPAGSLGGQPASGLRRDRGAGTAVGGGGGRHSGCRPSWTTWPGPTRTSTARGCGSAGPATPASTATSCCRRRDAAPALWDALLPRCRPRGGLGRARRPGHAADRDGLSVARAGPVPADQPGAGAGWAGRSAGRSRRSSAATRCSPRRPPGRAPVAVGPRGAGPRRAAGAPGRAGRRREADRRDHRRDLLADAGEGHRARADRHRRRGRARTTRSRSTCAVAAMRVRVVKPPFVPSHVR